MIPVQALCDYARLAVGGGYCYGSQGEVCSPVNRTAWAKANPSQEANLLGLCAKWDGKRVWDCSGLFRGAWKTLAGYKSGGATTIFKTWCKETGEIGTMPDEPGIAVFRAGAPGVMEHVGLYVGGGLVVDARGSAKGVLLEQIWAYSARPQGGLSARDSKESGDREAVDGVYPWTHWGRLSGVLYKQKEEETMANFLYQAKIKTKTGGGVGLWASTSTSNGGKLKQIPDDAVIDVLERLPNGWLKARYGGVEGHVQEIYTIAVVLSPDPDGSGDGSGDDDEMIPRADVARLYGEFRREMDALLGVRA